MANTENTNYITVETFNKGIQEIRTDIQVINTNINNLGKRLDDIQFFFSLFLVVITVMIAVIGLIPTITNFFRSLPKPEPALTVEKVQEMIDATVAKAQLKAGN